MKRTLTFALVLAALLVASTPAAAQQTRTVAITATAPSAIGILWHASDSVAVRPEFGFTRSSNETTSGTLSTVSTVKSTNISGAASLLFYTGKWDNLRAYVSPRFAIGRSKTTSSASSTSSSPNLAYQAGGSFGAQYSLGDRFGLFGEVGAAYSWQETEVTSLLNSSATTSKIRSFGTRSTLGIAFYF